MATPYYNVGKATLTAGSTTMTGQGTLWLGNVRSGDQVVSYTGQTAIVDTVNSNTSITLARAYRGTSQTAADYEIIYTPDDPFTQQLGRKVLEAINASALVKLGAVTPAARQLVRFDQAGNAALSPLSDYMLTLLDDADAGAARATLGISGAGSSVALRGVFVPPSPWPTEDLTPAAVSTMVGGQGYYQIFRDNAGAPAQTPPGWPQTYGAIWGFISSGNGYTYSWQKFTGWSGNREWVRKAINATTWGPWAEVYHQGNVIGAVSQVGGVPGGALSTGWQSNANGYYKREADGTQICICNPTINYTAAPVTPQTFTCPAAFVGATNTRWGNAIPVNFSGNATTQRDSTIAASSAIVEVGTTTYSVYITEGSLTVSVAMRLRLEGRWY